MLDSRLELVKALGLFDTPPDNSQIVSWRFGMHGEAHENCGPREACHQAPANLVEKLLILVVNAAAPQVDPYAHKVRACVPVNFHDIGGHSHPLLAV